MKVALIVAVRIVGSIAAAPRRKRILRPTGNGGGGVGHYRQSNHKTIPLPGSTTPNDAPILGNELGSDIDISFLLDVNSVPSAETGGELILESTSSTARFETNVVEDESQQFEWAESSSIGESHFSMSIETTRTPVPSPLSSSFFGNLEVRMGELSMPVTATASSVDYKSEHSEWVGHFFQEDLEFSMSMATTRAPTILLSPSPSDLKASMPIVAEELSTPVTAKWFEDSRQKDLNFSISKETTQTPAIPTLSSSFVDPETSAMVVDEFSMPVTSMAALNAHTFERSKWAVDSMREELNFSMTMATPRAPTLSLLSQSMTDLEASMEMAEEELSMSVTATATVAEVPTAAITSEISVGPTTAFRHQNNPLDGPSTIETTTEFSDITLSLWPTNSPTAFRESIRNDGALSDGHPEIPVESVMNQHTFSSSKASKTSIPTMPPTTEFPIQPPADPNEGPKLESPSMSPAAQSPTKASAIKLSRNTSHTKTPPLTNLSTPLQSTSPQNQTVLSTNTINATTTPPSPTFITDLETLTQLKLVNVSSTMKNKAIDVFERSCSDFLRIQLMPPILEVKCEVVDPQVLLAENIEEKPIHRLRKHRVLQKDDLTGVLGEQHTLLLSVAVKGGVDTSTDYATRPSDIQFHELVYRIFAEPSTPFVSQLKQDGLLSKIDYFEDLTRVLPTPFLEDSSNSTQHLASSNTKPKGNIDFDEMNFLTITAISLGGVGICILYGYVYGVGGKKEEGEEYGSSIASETEDVFDLMFDISQEQATNKNGDPITSGSNIGRSQESRNENLTYAYSLEDGLASPSSLSQQSISPNQLRNQITTRSSGEVSCSRRRIEIVAPSGKLGIIIDTCSKGPIVHHVKPTSPLEGLIFKGDLIVAVEIESEPPHDTREWSAHYLTKLVAMNSQYDRKITVLRVEKNGDDPDGCLEELLEHYELSSTPEDTHQN